MSFNPNHSISWTRAALLGSLVAGVLDATDGVVAYFLAYGMNPIQVLQFIASGALGKAAFSGGLGAALAGMVFHFFIAAVVAGVFAMAAARLSFLQKHWVAAGLVYGAGVWFFMNFIVLPMTQVEPAPPSIAMLLNGVIGHALFVGLPIAYYGRLIESETSSELSRAANGRS